MLLYDPELEKIQQFTTVKKLKLLTKLRNKIIQDLMVSVIAINDW